MRIVHVSDCYAPRTGGIETQVRSLAQAQAAAGDEVHVVTATPGLGANRAGSQRDAGVTVHRVVAPMPAELPVHPRTRHHVGRLLTALRPDVAHIHSGVISPFAWGGLRAAARCGVPRVLTVHSMWGPLATPAHRGLVRALPWRAPGTVITAVSAVAAASVARGLGCEVGVLPNGIDPGVWPAHDCAPEPGVVRVVSVLRLAPRKRAGALIDALERASRALRPEIALQARIIGDGPERRALQRRVEAAGMVDRIQLLGRRGPDEIRDEFTRSDVFVQASVRESFGIAALEARTSGVPVIARAQTGAGEFIIDGRSGVLAVDDDALVAGVVDLARDPDRLYALRRYCIEHPPEQTWPNVLKIAHAAYVSAGA